MCLQLGVKLQSESTETVVLLIGYAQITALISGHTVHYGNKEGVTRTLTKLKKNVSNDGILWIIENWVNLRKHLVNFLKNRSFKFKNSKVYIWQNVSIFKMKAFLQSSGLSGTFESLGGTFDRLNKKSIFLGQCPRANP